MELFGHAWLLKTRTALKCSHDGEPPLSFPQFDSRLPLKRHLSFVFLIEPTAAGHGKVNAFGRPRIRFWSCYQKRFLDTASLRLCFLTGEMEEIASALHIHWNYVGQIRPYMWHYVSVVNCCTNMGHHFSAWNVFWVIRCDPLCFIMNILI